MYTNVVFGAKMLKRVFLPNRGSSGSDPLPFFNVLPQVLNLQPPPLFYIYAVEREGD